MSNGHKFIDEMVEIFRKKYSSKLPDELEKAAAELAKKIAADNGYYPDPTDEDKYDEYEHAYNLIIKVCRKCLIDGFLIEGYKIWEIPYGDSDGKLMCWANKKDLETGESKCHSIDFWCQRDFNIAIPLKLVDNNPDEFPYSVPFETCGEAVFYE